MYITFENQPTNQPTRRRKKYRLVIKMDHAKQRAAAEAGRVYQDFDPQWKVLREEDCSILVIDLPGYTKEQLRVQLSKSGNLIISGEQPLGNNIWRRFLKTIPVSENCDISKISAQFKAFRLFIEQPKLITLAEKKDEEKPTNTEAPQPQKPEQSGQKPTSTTNYPAEQTNETSNNSAKKAGVVPDNAQEKEKEQETVDGKSNESNDSKNVQANAKSVSENNLTDEKTNGAAEDGKKIKESTNQKQESGLSNFAIKMVGGATRLKMPRKVMNLVLAIILAVALALYVKKSVSSWNIAEN